MNTNNIMKRSVFYILGLFILAFGIDILILTGMGTGAWDALNVGLTEQIGLTIGTWAQIVGVFLILIILLMKRPKTKKDILFQVILPLITMFILGNFIDFNLLWLNLSFTQWIVAFIAMLVGTVLMALGIALYLQADFGFIPIDGFVMAVYEKTGWSLRIAKTVVEIGALTVAFLLGGPIGIGTVFVTFLIGPLLQFFFSIIQKTFKLA